MTPKIALTLLLTTALVACAPKSEDPTPVAQAAKTEAEGKGEEKITTFNPEENPDKPAAPGGAKLADMKGLRLTVKNKTLINAMILAGSGLWIQEGKLFKNTFELSPGTAFCFLSASNSMATMKNGDALEFGEPQVKEKTTKAYVGDGKATLGCGKIAVDFSWSSLDLASAFGTSATITPL